jgi:hypothetical protein
MKALTMPMRLQTPERDREVVVDNSLAVEAHLEQILHVSFCISCFTSSFLIITA